MKKLLKPSDWLLLGLTGLLDLIDEMKDPMDLFDSYYKTYYGINQTKYSKKHYQKMLWDNLKTKNIEKVIKNDEVYLEVTRQGYDKIKKRFPLINFQNKTWDGLWRLVIYDIEENKRNERDYLRNKLKELDFAQMQKSVWITPHDFFEDIQQFLESSETYDKVILIETEKLYTSDVKILAYDLWNIDILESKYYSIIEELTDLQKYINENILNKNKTKKVQEYYYDRDKKVEQLRIKVLNIYFSDPYLPKELLPDDWIGYKVRKKVKEMKLF